MKSIVNKSSSPVAIPGLGVIEPGSSKSVPAHVEGTIENSRIIKRWFEIGILGWAANAESVDLQSDDAEATNAELEEELEELDEE